MPPPYRRWVNAMCVRRSTICWGAVAVHCKGMTAVVHHSVSPITRADHFYFTMLKKPTSFAAEPTRSAASFTAPDTSSATDFACTQPFPPVLIRLLGSAVPHC